MGTSRIRQNVNAGLAVVLRRLAVHIAAAAAYRRLQAVAPVACHQAAVPSRHLALVYPARPVVVVVALVYLVHRHRRPVSAVVVHLLVVAPAVHCHHLVPVRPAQSRLPQALVRPTAARVPVVRASVVQAVPAVHPALLLVMMATGGGDRF